MIWARTKRKYGTMMADYTPEDSFVAQSQGYHLYTYYLKESHQYINWSTLENGETQC